MISLIAAVAQNRAIGKNNELLWRLPEDMRHFRETTRGKAVVMGRKTWESLPAAFRPLPGRRNIVLTRDPAYVAEGAVIARSLADAVALAGSEEEVFVIGGAELYRQALPLAGRLYLTEVAETPDGDAFFPEISAADWQEIARVPQRNESGLEFAFVLYQRRPFA
ncbi:MAG: dihydrofolate reductase [Betaproteobacteria bacterium]|nr:dihydrofolate reductase [Betaproteobacteria bacterium]